MLLETHNQLAQPLKHAAPTASSAAEAVPWTAPRSREGAWIDLGCWRWDPGTVFNSSVSTPLLFDRRTAHFYVPTLALYRASRGGYCELLGAAA